ncbi:MAG: GNAT family N-acetyltransferase [Phycisphaerales bacterium]|nr:GNAT family N-acetyltransferase [Phycisphaerales bacterium]
MIRIQRITPGHALYAQEVALRELVLLKPIGYDHARFCREYPYEDRFVHFVAIHPLPTGDRVVGCALLLPPADGDGQAKGGKLMQMAVDPQRQREGIGQKLVVDLERYAFARLGLNRLYCHAQLSAVPFYERLGWIIEGEEFDEAGIPHRKMSFEAEVPGRA